MAPGLSKSQNTRPTILLNSRSDTGNSRNDLLTADATPGLHGKAEPGARVTIFDGSDVLGTTTASRAGIWRFSSPVLEEGEHDLRVVARSGGDKGVSKTLSVTIDTSAPAGPVAVLGAGSDTGISASDGITSDATPTLTGTAEAGSTVIVRAGGKVVGSAVADANGTWNLTAKHLVDGVYDLSATATDGAGNTSAGSAPSKIRVDTQVSAATIDLSATSDTGLSAADRITSATALALEGTAEQGATVVVRDGTVVLGTATADAGGAWSLTTAVLSEGLHGITATATDVAGNVAPGSPVLAVTIDTTTQTPTIDLVASSDTGTSAVDNLTSDTTPTLTGTAEAGATVVISDGSAVLGTVIANGTGTWSFTTGPLASGAHSFAVRAADLAGNQSTATLPLAVQIDAAAPGTPTIDLAASSDTGLSAVDNITADTTPDLVGTAEAGAVIRIMDGSALLGTTVADNAGAWAFTTAALTQGVHAIAVTATDAAGNTSAAVSLSVTVDSVIATPTIDLAASSDTGLSAADDLTSDATPTLSGTVDAGATVTVLDGSVVLGTAIADASGFWTFTTAKLTDGLHSFTARATDAAGNLSALSATLDVTIEAGRYDLSTLQPADGFVVQGDDADRHTGFSVSSAGDVNGDGFDDFIVGAPSVYSYGSHADEAYVVFGGASGLGTVDSSGRAIVDLAALTAADGFVLSGNTSRTQVGVSVSGAGDVNGDGLDDLLVAGAGQTSDQYIVVFGSRSTFGAIDAAGRDVLHTSDVTVQKGFYLAATIYSTAPSVSSAGDVNGDGFDDLIVGMPGASYFRNQPGDAYVVFGTEAGFGVESGGRAGLDLATLSAAEGFVVRGTRGEDYAGSSVSSLGDVNGDGFDDIVVGARNNSDDFPNGGQAYVIFGKASGFGAADGAGRRVINIASLTPDQGFVVQGVAGSDHAGCSVSSAGDVNGDGFDDIIVGAYWAKDGYGASGSAYVVFGTGSGFATTDFGGRPFMFLRELSADKGFKMIALPDGDFAGASVSSAGDVNGDGFDDLIVGAKGNDDGGNAAGAAYVVFGTGSGFGTLVNNERVIVLNDLKASEGFAIQGDAAGDGAGTSVSGAGDLNGDGFDDLIVGAPGGDDGGTDAGEAYVIYGSALGASAVAVTLTGTASADRLIGSLGDDTISGKGGADVLIGANGDDRIAVSSDSFARVSGGGGADTLAFDGAGLSIDFTQIANSRVSGIERLDLTGSGDNTARLSISDLFHFSDGADPQFTGAACDEMLVVDGNAGDRLILSQGTGSWALVSQDVGLDGTLPGSFDIYVYAISGATRGVLAVDADVTLEIV
jgi:hypothetical protein